MRKILALPLVALALVLVLVEPAAAGLPSRVIVLPGARSAEGIAAGPRDTFYASDLFEGDIYRGNLRRGTAELFIKAPNGEMAPGIDLDARHDLLFVARGLSGKADVYNVRTRALVASYRLGEPGSSLIND